MVSEMDEDTLVVERYELLVCYNYHIFAPQIQNQIPLVIRTYLRSTASNATLKPVISPFHDIPTT